jgi:hypothetical protein
MFLPPGRGHHVLVSHVLVFLSRQHVVGGVAEGFNELSAGGGVGSLQAGDRTWGGLYAISFLIVGTQRTRDALDMVVVFHRLLRVGDVARRARSTVYLSVVIREEVSSFFRADSGMDEVVGPGPLIVRAMRVPHHIITVVASSHQLTHLRPRQTEHVVRTRRTLRRPLGALGVGLARITVSLSLLSLEVTSIARGLSTGSRSNSENADEVNNSVVSTSIGGADRTINKSPLEGVTSRGKLFIVDSVAVMSSMGMNILLNTINREREASSEGVVITMKVRGIDLVAELDVSRDQQKHLSRKFCIIVTRADEIAQQIPSVSSSERSHGVLSKFINNQTTTNGVVTSRSVDTLVSHGGEVGPRFTGLGVGLAGLGGGFRSVLTVAAVGVILGDVDHVLQTTNALSKHGDVVSSGTDRASVQRLPHKVVMASRFFNRLNSNRVPLPSRRVADEGNVGAPGLGDTIVRRPAGSISLFESHNKTRAKRVLSKFFILEGEVSQLVTEVNVVVKRLPKLLASMGAKGGSILPEASVVVVFLAARVEVVDVVANVHNGTIRFVFRANGKPGEIVSDSLSRFVLASVVITVSSVRGRFGVGATRGARFGSLRVRVQSITAWMTLSRRIWAVGTRGASATSSLTRCGSSSCSTSSAFDGTTLVNTKNGEVVDYPPVVGDVLSGAVVLGEGEHEGMGSWGQLVVVNPHFLAGGGGGDFGLNSLLPILSDIDGLVTEGVVAEDLV